MDADADDFRPLLRINVVERSFEGSLNSSALPPQRPTVDDDLIGDDLNDYENDDEEDRGTALKSGYSFSDGTNFCYGKKIIDKKELKILLDAAAARQSFDYYIEKSCTKLIKYETSDRFCIYKYIGLHACGVKHATRRHKKVSSELIVSVCVNHFRDGKGPSIREIQKIVFKELHCNASYWMCWKGSVIAKNIIHGTPEHGYACLPTFSYMVELLNPGSFYSIMVNRIDGSFVYYFLAFGACIRGYAHMRKVIAFDDTYLYEKYGGVLLSVVAQNTENHIFLIVFRVFDKKNDAS
ncbi:uncharacterized protein LOC124895891 [Capsicum annuum]|uniref:uncharacterized protein LOC124895891 n=1 Tax=Capsicum annuum TaxID=4072 RepID=UPI001FB12B4C|nr:uncharacterized protein LOC124895891 [Capsicum annuum]